MVISQGSITITLPSTLVILNAACPSHCTCTLAGSLADWALAVPVSPVRPVASTSGASRFFKNWRFFKNLLVPLVLATGLIGLAGLASAQTAKDPAKVQVQWLGQIGRAHV